MNGRVCGGAIQGRLRPGEVDPVRCRGQAARWYSWIKPANSSTRWTGSSPVDEETGRQRAGGRGGLQVKASVRPGRVVVAHVFGQHPVQVVLVPNQCPVQAFRPDRANPPFSVRVRAWHPRRDFDH